MINFNIPPFVGKETEYIKQAVANHKICGDGEFTKKCSSWLEEKTGTSKALLTTSCTHATEMAALLCDIKLIHLCQQQMRLYCGGRQWFLWISALTL